MPKKSRQRHAGSSGSQPSQSRNQREEERELRRRHRELEETIEEQRAELVNPGSKVLEKNIKQANELGEQVGSTREFYKNAAIFAGLSGAGLEQAKRLAVGLSKYTPDVYATRLLGKYSGEAELGDDPRARFDAARRSFDWCALGRRHGTIFKVAPTLEFMDGPMELKARERKKVVRQQREKIGEMIRPDEMQDTAEDSEEHTRLMTMMHRKIREHKGYQLFWPLCLCEGMGQTVLKMFACCHLAKEGRISVKLNAPRADGRKLCPDHDDGELLIGPVSKASGAGGGAADGAGSNLQFIMSMDMAEYRLMVEKYGVAPAEPSPNRRRLS